ncbi:HEAT repeat domain-containing protein [Actinoplanes bogorensis]|uniref:HEAT repeat domain-containing protein n=1 Tax=Paractinoplanes bogorensis TaxID=1610840 RepID=A0ABS5YNU5_9ACTN|nr:HEAT repeat domain-containing protein [Actinoplanes bogorensis]MBU2665124.1 HEAT repeat domain-containing protein [Actinoplanes bogorensis]
MLEKLDEVPWSDLSHAYGPADDVPAQLRALLSPEAEVRRKARHDSYGNIFHQGTRYEASAPAVPFLLEMLAEPSTPERAELLELLVALAIGYDEAWLPGGFPLADYEAAAAGGEVLLQAGGGLSESDQNALQAHIELRVHSAVALGVPLFRTLLEDEDPAVRRCAACALGWFPAQAEASSAALTWSLLDPGDTVAATAALSLGLLGSQPLTAETLTAAFAGPRVAVRGAAAIALARLHGREASAAVVDELLRLSGDGETTGVPFHDGNLSGYAALSLRLVLPDDSETAFAALLDRIPSVSGQHALPVVAEALRRAFDQGALGPDTPFDDLTDRQKRLARALAASPSTWQLGGHVFANFSLMVGDYGLPSSHQRMLSFTEAS